jgi:hypothetical protein
MKDYSEYSSTAGLSTKHWGPKGWYFLFSCIMGGYPVKFDRHDKEHRRTRKAFRHMFRSLAYTMPCSFCRNSYREFIKELPIGPFLKGRIHLMAWLYFIRDKVNKKLIQQEKECYKREFDRLLKLYNREEITKSEFAEKLRIKKEEIFITVPSPPFRDVLNTYEAIRATCSPKAKTCSVRKN